MPQNLVDVATTFTTPVVAPVDTDGANSASVVAGFQPLANRTAYLNRLVANGDSSALNGVANLRNAASTSAMSALTGIVNLGTCFVSGAGLFFYLSGSSATVDGVFVFNATGMGVGRWVHEIFPLIGAANGIPQLDGSSRVPAATVRNGIITQGLARLSANFTTTSTTFVDVTGSTITLSNCAVGDVIFIDFAALVLNAASSNGQIIAAVVDGGVTVGRNESWNTTNGAASGVIIPGVASHTVGNAGTITVKLQTLTTNAANSTTVYGSTGATQPNTTIRAFVMRP